MINQCEFSNTKCSSSGKRMRVREMERRDQDWKEEKGKLGEVRQGTNKGIIKE